MSIEAELLALRQQINLPWLYAVNNGYVIAQRRKEKQNLITKFNHVRTQLSDWSTWEKLIQQASEIGEAYRLYSLACDTMRTEMTFPHNDWMLPFQSPGQSPVMRGFRYFGWQMYCPNIEKIKDTPDYHSDATLRCLIGHAISYEKIIPRIDGIAYDGQKGPGAIFLQRYGTTGKWTIFNAPNITLRNTLKIVSPQKTPGQGPEVDLNKGYWLVRWGITSTELDQLKAQIKAAIQELSITWNQYQSFHRTMDQAFSPIISKVRTTYDELISNTDSLLRASDQRLRAIIQEYLPQCIKKWRGDYPTIERWYTIHISSVRESIRKARHCLVQQEEDIINTLTQWKIQTDMAFQNDWAKKFSAHLAILHPTVKASAPTIQPPIGISQPASSLITQPSTVRSSTDVSPATAPLSAMPPGTQPPAETPPANTPPAPPSTVTVGEFLKTTWGKALIVGSGIFLLYYIVKGSEHYG